MSKYIEGFTGEVATFDPAVDGQEDWTVCSAPVSVAGFTLAHSIHTDFREAKLEQIRLFIEEGIDAWLEHWAGLSAPSIEMQLDAAIKENAS